MAIEPDGSVIAHSGAGPHGQGHETTFAQIVADALGVEPDAVELRFGDSATSPAGIGTFASRSTAMAGSALLIAAREVRERLDARRDGAARGARPLRVRPRVRLRRVRRGGRDRARDRRAARLRIAAVDDAGTIVNPLLAEGQVLGGAVHGLGAA